LSDSKDIFLSGAQSGQLVGCNQPAENVADFRNCGFVRDGVPWLFDDEAQDWLPVTQSKYAARYAAMQKRA
jgi:hypothetical protein